MVGRDRAPGLCGTAPPEQVGPRSKYAVSLSVNRALGGRHWTRTSDLLHVKHRGLCIVAVSVASTQDQG
jgi:hypothetical protein